MTTKLFPFALIAVTTFVSCSDTKKEEESVQVYNNAVVDTVAAKTALPDSLIIKSILQPVVARSLPGLPEDAPQTISTTAALPGTNNARLNPAHGQPGHRCDIAVGAPLDSKPLPAGTTAPQAPVAATQVVPTTTTVQPVSQKVAPGMNPAHGQPNHRCDIAVGAPLNSKPATNSVAKTTATTSTPAPVQKVAPGMNPSHGQPGHRCDIAVGAPLDSKPTVTAPIPAVTKPADPEPVKTDSTKK